MIRKLVVVLFLVAGMGHVYGAPAKGGDQWILGQYVRDGKINTGSGHQALNIRSGPGTDFSTVGSLNYGSAVTVYDKKGGWFKISAPVEVSPAPVIEGEQWIIGQFVKNGVVDTGDGQSALNVRSGPGNSFSAVTALRYNDEVTVFAEENGWFRLTPESKEGQWALAQYITYSKEGRVDTGSSGALLTVRSGPGVGFSTVDSLSPGATVTVSAVEDGWFCISALVEVADVIAEDDGVQPSGPELLPLLLGSAGVFLLLLLRRS